MFSGHFPLKKYFIFAFRFAFWFGMPDSLPVSALVSFSPVLLLDSMPRPWVRYTVIFPVSTRFLWVA
jgi:hypothetical protein